LTPSSISARVVAIVAPPPCDDPRRMRVIADQLLTDLQAAVDQRRENRSMAEREE
jgi:hypothetical protein